MKKGIVLLIACLAALVVAQENSSITVKETTVTTGVVVVDAQLQGKAVELQCNQQMSGCQILKRGNYVMVQLAKNHGTYDCQNVEVYAEGANPDRDQKIGGYCLIPK